MHKNILANHTVDGMNIVIVGLNFKMLHMQKCQLIQGTAGRPSSAVEMGWAFYRIIEM